MAKNKLRKFAELATFPFVYQNYDFTTRELVDSTDTPIQTKGRWKEIFGNDNPITLELACGGGEYTVALSEKYPDRNFVGVDIKGARIWKGATQVIEKKLNNVSFLRTRIELLAEYFEQGEVDEIWITFPDPHLKKSKAQKRLTSHRFLQLYLNLIKPKGIVQLKTDDPTLYEFTLESVDTFKDIMLLEEYEDIYSLPTLPLPELAVKTYYERMHLEIGRTIKYVKMTTN